MLDIQLAANTVVEQEVPTSYSGFLHPLQGEVLAERTAPQRLSVGQIGWLECAGA
jgi:hypothetical protein